jgi:hypothetical protein
LIASIKTEQNSFGGTNNATITIKESL